MMNGGFCIINNNRYFAIQSTQVGLDMNCNQTNNFIDESSHLRLFNYRFNWLIYDDKANFSRFYNKFKQVNLSVDTEMTFIVPKPIPLQIPPNLANGTSVYKAFDVYNNGWFIGGSINITMNYEMQCNVTACHLA
ncbi:hypothetical protein DOY81_010393, partial [Sarcophaga bullata]